MRIIFMSRMIFDVIYEVTLFHESKDHNKLAKWVHFLDLLSINTADKEMYNIFNSFLFPSTDY